MYLINTSFHVDQSQFDTLVEFINQRLVPALNEHSHLQSPTLLEILISVDPSVRSLSLQFHTPDIESATETINTVSAPLIAEITTLCCGPEPIVSYTNPMRIINNC